MAWFVLKRDLLTYISLNNLLFQATELLYTGQQLTADDAFRRGLVSKLCWPEKYKDTVKFVVASISKGSKQVGYKLNAVFTKIP